MSGARTESAVWAALRAALLAVTGLDVIRARTILPRPTGPYIAIRRLWSEGIGRIEHDEQQPGTWRQHRQLAAQIDAVGDTAIDALTDAAALMQSRAPVRAALATAEIGIASVGQVRDVTRSTPAGWEPVGTLDVVLSYTHEIATTEPPGASLSVTLTGTDGTVTHGPITVLETDPGDAATPILHTLDTLAILPHVGGVVPL